MQRLNSRREAGFTLVESLVAMLLVSVAAAGLLALTLKSLQQATESYHRSIATGQAESLIHELWAGLCTLPENGFITIYTRWQQQMRSAATGEPILPGWGSQPLSLTLIDNGTLYRVPVTVYWGPEAQRASHQVTLVALLPRQVCS